MCNHKNNFYITIIIFLLTFIIGCSKKNVTEEVNVIPKANVEVTSTGKENLNDTIFFTASSFYNNKTTVIAPISGYLSEVNITNGLNISRDKKIFEILTKEYNALKSSKDILDSLNLGKKAGRIEIFAPSSGQVSDLNTLQGQYVQEGSALCNIIDMGSLLFKLYVPLQYHADISPGVSCTLLLPDGQKFTGSVKSLFAKTELNSQTEVYFMKPSTLLKIPEGVNIKAYFVRQKKYDSQVLPREAVLSNETLEEYWVMKLINDTTAIKVPVKIGTANKEIIEIISPKFSTDDKIVTSGNYGLPDTAFVNITIEPDEK